LLLSSSAIVKPDKPLLYLCDESTHITNIAVCPITNGKKPASLSTIPPFVTILKLQYEGPVVEGEHDDDDDKENVNSSKPTAGKPDKKQAKKGQDSDDALEEDDDEDDDSDFSGIDIEAKEVVVGCFTPNVCTHPCLNNFCDLCSSQLTLSPYPTRFCNSQPTFTSLPTTNIDL
jgi:hypothetical protein